MKIRHKMMLLSLFALLALPLFMVGPGGKPLMSLNDWMPGDVTISSASKKLVKTWNTASGALKQSTGIDMAVKTPKLYKWKDAKGRWQFSNDPPSAGADEVFVQDMPQMSNVMRPVEMRDRADAGGGSNGSGFKLAFPTSVPFKEIPKLIDDAKNLQKTAEIRQRALDNI